MKMNNLIRISLLAIAVLCSVNSFSQSNKKHKRNKGTSKREIKKRQQEANDRDNNNAFNPKQPMGAKQNESRDDLLWHGEAANTVYKGTFNLSLVSPSRYGLKPDLELSSSIFANYWLPNLFVKKRWYGNEWYVASKHGFYSATPGFNWAEKNGYHSFINDAEQIPFVLSMKNELMVSRLFMSSGTCTRSKPFLILTGGLGVDFGVPFGDSDLTELEGHFITNRSPALIGTGYTAYAKLRADWQINNIFMLGGGFKYYRGDFSGNGAFEHNADVQMFILPQFSVSLGYMLSVANYPDASSVGILPFFDLTYYFGRRQSRQKGLFGGKMY